MIRFCEAPPIAPPPIVTPHWQLRSSSAIFSPSADPWGAVEPSSRAEPFPSNSLHSPRALASDAGPSAACRGRVLQQPEPQHGSAQHPEVTTRKTSRTQPNSSPAGFLIISSFCILGWSKSGSQSSYREKRTENHYINIFYIIFAEETRRETRKQTKIF